MALGWHALASLEEIQRTGRIVREFGNKEVCALWQGGRLWVFNSVCPHAGGPLGEGKAEGDPPVVRCPWHGYLFNVKDRSCSHTGLSLKTPAFRVEGDRVLVEVDPEGAPHE